METGSASVKVLVEGTGGSGEAIVPVMAVATAKRDMAPSLGWILAGLGLLLFVLMVTIIGASVSDGTLQPGKVLSTA
jgi:protein-S-isoprenylcysteine O-methyltransferase Ste14